ncbi:hypothetical protein FO489_23605, partial [Bacillus licheniformis]
MADKCCNSKNDPKKTENKTESCCGSAVNLNIKKEDSSCCASNNDSVNTFKSIPVLIQGKTSCCSSETSKEIGNDQEKEDCCSIPRTIEHTPETNSSCCSETMTNEDKNPVKTSCCSSNENQAIETILNPLPSGEKMAYRVQGMD